MRAVALSLLLLVTAAGQELRAPWSPLPDPLPAGVQAFEATLDGPVRAFAVTVDLGRSDLDVRPVVSGEKAGKEPLTALAEKAGTVAAVNASYFDTKSDPCAVIGWLVLDGRPLSGPTAAVTQKGLRYPVARAAVFWPETGRPRLAWATRRDGQLLLLDRPVPNRTGAPAAVPDDAPPADAVRHAIGAGPMLLRAGKPLIPREEERMFLPDDVRHPRTALALKGQTLMLLVADGRCPESQGLSLAELADLLRRLGAEDAMNLDGGGSSTLVIGTRLANRPCGGLVQRPVPAGVGVFRKAAAAPPEPKRG